MIDLHCHVLPGLDDGPETIEQSLALAAAAAAGGTRTIVATPHVSWQWPRNDDAATIEQGVQTVNAVLREHQIAIEIVAGAELALSRAADLDRSQLEALRLGRGPWLLVECPLAQAAAGFERGVGALMAQGHRIVLAHPERCPAFQRDPGRLTALVEGGALTSLTASALTGHFGKTVKRFAFDLLRRGLVHNVASDAHDAVGRPPALAAELDAAGLGEHSDLLARALPEAILDGTAVPVPAAPMHVRVTSHARRRRRRRASP